MATDRRNFLKALAATALGGLPAQLLATPSGTELLACRGDGAGRYYASLFDTAGALLMDVPLPGRGHDIAVSPDGRFAAVVARRPGDFLWLLDLPARRVHRRLRATADRHYFGHAVFSDDGQRLYVVENDFEQGVGRIGVHRTDGPWPKLDELPSHGVGPHEILLHGDMLIVANGGILTHPDTPRAKLNLDTMAPSLAYVDRHDGRLLERVEPPPRWHQLSMRHIDRAPDGQVAIAMQYQGPADDTPPLVALHARGGPLRWLHAPAPVQRRMRNYCGSVAFSADGAQLAVSSPRGGLVVRWSGEGHWLGHHDQADVCGLAAAAGRLWASDGGGRLAPLAADVPGAGFARVHWDNHLAARPT
jgi:hypothetical protein